MNKLRAIIFLSILSFLSHQLVAQCEDSGNVWNLSWKSCEINANPNPNRGNSHWFQVEFLQPENISTTHIWNANRVGESQIGAREVFIDYTIDGINWEQLGLGAFTFQQGDESDLYEGFEGPNFGGVFVKKILFTVINNHANADDCIAMGEVRFDINPNACYGALDVCGVCNGEGELIWYKDEDNDNLGDPNQTINACEQPVGYVSNNDDECDNGLVGWTEVAAVFGDNGCTGCHGNGAQGGLNLLTYETAIIGGNKCGSSVWEGSNLINIITQDNYNGCGTPISFPSMNARTGNQIDSDELALLQDWINEGALDDCNCPIDALDEDEDGTCDNSDKCPSFDDNLIGTACDDGDECTENDMYTADCECRGESKPDSDNDGICDDLDAAPNNGCTADGSIDGIEPDGWNVSNSYDCDQDGYTYIDGDLDDFDECINDIGFSLLSMCNCPTGFELLGGTYIESEDISEGDEIDNPERAEGVADGVYAGNMLRHDYMTFSTPYLEKGEEICVHLWYNHPTGSYASVEFNGYHYSMPNSNEETGAFEFCYPVLRSGKQTVKVQSMGPSRINVDAISYKYCNSTCDITSVPEFDEGTHQAISSFTHSDGYEYYCNVEGNLLLGLDVDESLSVNPTDVKLFVSESEYEYRPQGTGFVNSSDGAVEIMRRWDVNASGNPSGTSGVRYFLRSSDEDAVDEVLEDESVPQLTGIEDLQFFKILSQGDYSRVPVSDIDSDDVQLITHSNVASSSTYVFGYLGGHQYASYEVESFSSGGTLASPSYVLPLNDLTEGESFSKKDGIVIYPTITDFYVQVSVRPTDVGETIYMYSANGSLLRTKSIENQNEILYLNDLAGGVYYIHLLDQVFKVFKL